MLEINVDDTGHGASGAGAERMTLTVAVQEAIKPHGLIGP